MRRIAAVVEGLWNAFFGRRVARAAPKDPRLWTFLTVDDFPDNFAPKTLYVSGYGPHRWSAGMVCPCGCSEVIRLNLLRQSRPSWRLIEHRDRTVSLSPSVWRKKGCRSHFFFTRSRIEWCLSEHSMRSRHSNEDLAGTTKLSAIPLK